ncbi:zinc ribbon domain-containing protein YjdM [Acinetobacter baumannii]|uniref:zinc ribbon domain-containing protein YjdM n=1 Tax=Acinetobacter baumannii TaxID=470 RepID=UPI001F5B586A|nr:zinc ribbon domain-containing protein YjdM [Acinetobacter baumannii]
MSLPNCPKCQSEYTYQDGDLLICPECSHEWKEGEALVTEEQEVIKDANGNVLADGDSVTVIKDLKIKGSSSVVKVGTKVKSIRLVPDASDGHNINYILVEIAGVISTFLHFNILIILLR